MLRFEQGQQLLDSDICFMQLGLSMQLCLIGNILSSWEFKPILIIYIPYYFICPILNRCSLGLCLLHGNLGIFLKFLLAIGFHGHTIVHRIWLHGSPNLLGLGFHVYITDNCLGCTDARQPAQKKFILYSDALIYYNVPLAGIYYLITQMTKFCNSILARIQR